MKRIPSGTLARTWTIALTTALLFTACAIPTSSSQTAAIAARAGTSRCGAPTTTKVFIPNAFGSDWSKADNLIAFNQVGAGGYYHIYTVRPDGTHRTQLGVGSSTFPQRTTGSPAWHPSGKFIAFIAEKTGNLPGNLTGDTFGATPGWGDYSDLWVSTADGSTAWQLTNLAANANDRTIMPQFSPDGRMLEWTESFQQQSGFMWQIKLAQFHVASDGHPYLSGIQTFAPGDNNRWIETGGFSPDSTKMLFTSDYQNDHWTASQIYSLDVRSGAITRLTHWNFYDEHPRFTPDGRVVWMTDAYQPASHSSGDDWWIMNADGTNPQRLTSFNDPSSPEFYGRQVYATVANMDSWSTDGSWFYGDVEQSLVTSHSDIVRVQLTCR